MALTRYDPTIPIQFLIFNSSPTLVGALYQPQGMLEWLHTPMGSAPRILNEVDALTSMIKNGRDRALKTLEKEPEILVSPFSLWDIQWLIKNHSCFTISLIGFQVLYLREMHSLTKPPQQGHSWSPLKKQTNFIHAHTQI